MKTLHKIILLSLVLTIFSCRGIRELKTLSKCQFKMGQLTDANLAGVMVQSISSFSDLSLLDAGRVTKALTSGRLPLSFTLNVEAKNPNKTNAAMGRLAYIAFIDNVEIVRGDNLNRVVIPANGGVANIPLKISADLLDVLSNSEKRSKLLNFGLNLADKGGKPTRVSLKIKPSIKIGQKSIPYPGFFTVGHTFGSD